MKIRTASLCYQYDNVWVEIRDTPLRAYLVPEVSGIVCDALGSRLCTPPEWTWQVRWGPKDEEYDLADKSLGHLWHTLGQKLHGAFWKTEKVVVKIPVTHDWVRENWPGHTLSDDDEDVTPKIVEPPASLKERYDLGKIAGRLAGK